ncbi:hypothetical protein BT96DRAFT_939786 [Gymnopus androsaceus JB14]|uniref:Uncharacterized protein n=1 Tax=Gymnopus androsaceus JB14 TaxID=1447944 RepID=A0A6A4HNP8_9AGAR|nr:hypothetical protein BT96DRAFT_939786 [Gymnopus androsaceus JB14]
MWSNDSNTVQQNSTRLLSHHWAVGHLWNADVILFYTESCKSPEYSEHIYSFTKKPPLEGHDAEGFHRRRVRWQNVSEITPSSSRLAPERVFAKKRDDKNSEHLPIISSVGLYKICEMSPVYQVPKGIVGPQEHYVRICIVRKGIQVRAAAVYSEIDACLERNFFQFWILSTLDPPAST